MNEELLHIESLAYGGDGIGHLADGRIVFVARTCPGDVAHIRVRKSQDTYATGELVGLDEASTHRVKPLCEEATRRCGGCPWAHVDCDTQLYWKRQAVVDALEHIAKFDPSRVAGVVGHCIASKEQWNYRNKVEFEVGQDIAGRLALGMYARGSSFAPLSACELCPKKLRDVPKALTGAIRFVQGNAHLGIERVGVRASQRTGDVEVALWTRPGRFPRARAAQIICQALLPKKISLVRVLLKGKAAERKAIGIESLAGRNAWAETVKKQRMLICAPSFFQVNTQGAEVLIDLVVEGLELRATDTVFDLYAGAGTFTLPLAQLARELVAVESYRPAVRDLRRNLERCHLEAEVVCGDVARELQHLDGADAIVVDPPRSGLPSLAVEGLVSVGARRIAYVSCNPTTLARDLALICANGYRLSQVTPVDLFPQSYHVECVAILEHV